MKKITNLFYLVSFLCLTIFIQPVAGGLLRFEWTDDYSETGTFVLDTTKGLSIEAISEFSYIDYYGDRTPVGFSPIRVNIFEFGWSIQIGTEDATFQFNTIIPDPLPASADFYMNDFDSGLYLCLADTRTWDAISVTQVPEPATICLLGLSGLLLRKRRA